MRPRRPKQFCLQLADIEKSKATHRINDIYIVSQWYQNPATISLFVQIETMEDFFKADGLSRIIFYFQEVDNLPDAGADLLTCWSG